jgi:hypothetical protein
MALEIIAEIFVKVERTYDLYLKEGLCCTYPMSREKNHADNAFEEVKKDHLSSKEEQLLSDSLVKKIPCFSVFLISAFISVFRFSIFIVQRLSHDSISISI